MIYHGDTEKTVTSGKEQMFFLSVLSASVVKNPIV